MYCPELTRWPKITEKIEKERDTFSNTVITKAIDIGVQIGISIDCVTSAGIPTDEIANFIYENGIYKMLVIGHGRELIFSNSIVKTIILNSKIPVLVTNADFCARKILIAIEYEKYDIALKSIAFLRKMMEASFTIIVVYPNVEDEFLRYGYIADVLKMNNSASIKEMKDFVYTNGAKVLERVRQTLLALDITNINTVMKEGEWASEVINEAKQHDLLIVNKQSSSTNIINSYVNRLLSEPSLNIIFLPQENWKNSVSMPLS